MLFLLILILTLFSAFFSGSEAAIFSQDIRRLKRGTTDVFSPKLRKTIIGWLKKPERVITGIILGNLVVNIAITDAGEAWLIELFADFNQRHVLFPLIITLYILTFSEVIPKIIALVFKDLWIRALQLPLRGWFRLSNRFTIPFDKIANAAVKSLKGVKSDLTESELLEAVRFAERHGLLKGEEMHMLSRSIAFHHNTIYAAMIPRSQLLMLPAHSTLSQCKKAFSQSTHSFATIYKKNPRDIQGVVYLRGVVQLALLKKKEIEEKMYSLDFLPASMSLSRSLSFLIDARRDLAGVVDESGAFMGMVTLRGILNHILGSSFKTAPVDEYLTPIDARRYRVAAQMPLDRFNEIFRTTFDAALAETIGGFLLEKFDGFPHNDAEIEIGSLVFKDFLVADHKITSFVLWVKKNAT
ncbi:MAG TPA: CNNM domain-containing protein [Turneriella sp.]|nr:CNNM domain-containing protein [Turneriella sp.]